MLVFLYLRDECRENVDQTGRFLQSSGNPCDARSLFIRLNPCDARSLFIRLNPCDARAVYICLTLDLLGPFI